MIYVERCLHVPRETVERYWSRHLKAIARHERIERDRKILRQAAQGFTNDQIAEHFGLHPSTVSRIIQRHLRA